MCEQLSGSAILLLVVRNGYAEAGGSLPRNFRGVFLSITSLVIATLAFKTFQMVSLLHRLWSA